MNKEEIKEILERSKNLKNKCSCCEQVGENVYISKYHEIQTQNLAEGVYLIDKLLDYITNLQQDLDKANDIIEKDRQFYKCRMDEYVELKEEIERLNNIINELENILKLMINYGYYDTPNGDYEGTTVQQFMATGENSEFGVRAKFILYKLKELKESGNNEF